MEKYIRKPKNTEFRQNGLVIAEVNVARLTFPGQLKK